MTAYCHEHKIVLPLQKSGVNQDYLAYLPALVSGGYSDEAKRKKQAGV